MPKPAPYSVPPDKRWGAIRIPRWVWLGLLVIPANYYVRSCRAEQRAQIQAAPERPYIGRIYLWDPVIRDPSGRPTGALHTLPANWHYCDGSDGTANLNSGSMQFVTPRVPGAAIPPGATLPTGK